MMRIVYNLAIALLDVGIRLHAFFNKKSAGRLQVLKEVAPPSHLNNHSKVIWIHCASHGELIMATPLIARFKKEDPQSFIAVSFFSYSGYRHKTKDSNIDWYGMLPIDTAKNASNWVSRLKPDIAIFVKYEFWWNYLKELTRHNCKIYNIATRFPELPSGFYYKLYLPHLIGLYHHFFTANKHTESHLHGMGVPASYVGDPRSDALLQQLSRKKTTANNQKHATNNKNNKTIVWGSIWPEDLHLIKNMVKDDAFADWKHIIVPHEISKKFTHRIAAEMPKVEGISIESKGDAPARIHIFDKVGQLRMLYGAAYLCYVGGGFNQGVHNVLEPAFWGKPVLFGPHFKKDPAALDWVKNKTCKPVENYEMLKHEVLNLSAEEAYRLQSDKITTYFRESTGATDRIYAKIQAFSSSSSAEA